MIDGDYPYEPVGFHAQQSCEKALKAVLAVLEVAYPHTHNLAVLVDLLRTIPAEVPEVVERTVLLTTFAVLYRYDDFGIDDRPLGLEAMRQVVGGVQLWAAAVVHPPTEA